jgi:hypothetical protein
MNLQCIRQTFAALALGVIVLTPAALAEPPADKGKPEAVQGQDRDKGVDKTVPGHEAHPQDDNRGAVVSDCNHRANTRKLQGADRQDYVEWCTERGARHQYDDRRFDLDRACYRRASDKGLAGDARRAFIAECLHERERNR